MTRALPPLCRPAGWIALWRRLGPMARLTKAPLS